MYNMNTVALDKNVNVYFTYNYKEMASNTLNEMWNVEVKRTVI